jgi:xanthine dehydrogenase/oxidase
MNGLIDLGQIEGSFIMGLGYILLEKSIYDPTSGKCLNSGTWEYKPPTSRDIPIDFRVKMIENKPNPVGILGSKSAGEPPLILCSSIWMAIKHAIASAREDRGVKGYFQLDLPATLDQIQKACLVDPFEFKLSN